MTNFTDLTVSSLTANASQLIAPTTADYATDTPAIAVKHGVARLTKAAAGTSAATLADPTATTDDFKRLVIISTQAKAHTVTSATSFGGGGGGEDVATNGAVIGACLALIAYQGKWYVTGFHDVTIA